LSEIALAKRRFRKYIVIIWSLYFDFWEFLFPPHSLLTCSSNWSFYLIWIL